MSGACPRAPISSFRSSARRPNAKRSANSWTSPLIRSGISTCPRPSATTPSASAPPGKLAERVAYGDALDSLLYDSADSYAQTRNSYLSYRRYQLGDTESGAADYIDPEALDTEGF